MDVPTVEYTCRTIAEVLSACEQIEKLSLPNGTQVIWHGPDFERVTLSARQQIKKRTVCCCFVVLFVLYCYCVVVCCYCCVVCCCCLFNLLKKHAYKEDIG